MDSPAPDYQRLFEACPHPYLVLLPDPAFTIVAVDDRYLAVTGTSRSEILGRGLFEVFPDNPGNGKATGVSDLRTSLNRVLRENLQDVMGVQQYDIPRRPDGEGFEVRYWSPVNTPVAGDDGAIAMIIHHVEDITEFVLAGQGAAPDGPGSDQARWERTRAEAEVLRRAGEVKATNRRIKALLEEQERRAAELRQAERDRMGERLRDLDEAGAALRRNVFHRLAVPQAVWARDLAAAGMFAAAILLWLPIHAAGGRAPFVTFYPAVVLASFLCGLGPGLLATLLGLLVGYAAIAPPVWPPSPGTTEITILAAFAISGVAICAIIHRFLRAAGQIDAVNRQLAATAEALKQDIAQRNRTESALRDSEEKFRSSFEHAAIGKALIAPDGRCLQANPALCAMLGHSPADFEDLFFQDIAHPDDYAAGQSLGREMLAGTERTARFELRCRHRNGDPVWAQVSASLLRDAAGAPIHFIAEFQDVTERKEAERTLFQAQKMESLGQLTGGIAHDVNNVLQVILSNLDLSLAALGGSPAVAGYLQNAMAGAEQGAKLTGRLLAFARRQPLHPEPLRIDRLVGEMTSLLRRTLGATIDIELVTAADLWTALVDANQLQNAILNLTLNARDAMPDGGKLVIELANAVLDDAYAAEHREVKVGEYVRLAITDSGCGMAPEIREKVFEPFFTTKPEGIGTGLGLSMVFGFVKQSEGHISIYSEIGHGTSLKLYLPRSRQAELRQAARSAEAVRGNGETILVAEDDDGVRASVTTQLLELGYRVLAVANGEAALDVLAGDEAIDLLFTDVVMPGPFNGRLLADRATTLRPGLSVVFTSGYTENAIIHHGRLDPGVVLLSKPYRLAQLAETVRLALAGPTARSNPEPTGADMPDRPSPPPHILLVEDEELVRGAFAEFLEQFGYRVTATGKPSEALARLAADPEVQLLICDVNLPEMNGIDLAREAMARCPGLAIILASGQQLNPADLPDPSIGILLKPFRPAELQKAVATALQGRP